VRGSARSAEMLVSVDMFVPDKNASLLGQHPRIEEK